jgi:hypothetical protein
MTIPGEPFEEQGWSDLVRSLRELLGETVSGLAGVIGQERTVAIAQAFLSLGDQVARHAVEIPEREREAVAALIARLAASTAFAAGEPLEVHVDGERWRQVERLEGSGPDDSIFLLDPASGTVRFGDGEHGRRPAEGSRVSVTYREAPAGAAITVHIPWPPAAHHYAIELLPDAGVRVGPTVGGPGPTPGIPPEAGAGGVAAAGIRRVNFFNGKLLTAADLREEQTYQIERRRLHNRALHGPGVVDGLQLRLEDIGAEPAVTVNRGFALDPRGREVILPDPLTLAIPAGPSPLLVVVEYGEQPADPVPVPGSLAPIPSRIEEGARVRLLEEPGGAEGPSEGIAVGRLLCQEGQWRIDPAFQPQRPRH